MLCTQRAFHTTSRIGVHHWQFIMQTRRKKRTIAASDLNPPNLNPPPAKKPKKKTIKPLKTPSPLTNHPDVRTRATRIGDHLDRLYPEPAIPLNHASPFQLLVSVMLSAQTTDVKVNQITPVLFAHAPDAARMAAADVKHIEQIIKEIGLARTCVWCLCVENPPPQ